MELTLTKNQILEFANSHGKKWLPEEIEGLSIDVGFEYAKQYEGTFPFMQEMKSRVINEKPLSNAQLAGILNCARNEAKSQLKVESVSNLEVVDTSVPESLDEVLSRLKVLENNVKEFNNSPLPTSCREVIGTASAEEERLFNEFQKAITKVREDKAKAESELAKFENELKDIQSEIDYLKTKEAEFLKLKAAEEKLEEIKATLREIAESFEWNSKLRPYQWDDICHIAMAFLGGKNGVLNANDMGLGKTFETVAMLDILDTLFYSEHDRLPVVLWLTKKSLVSTTFNEFKKWNPTKKIVKITKIPDKSMRDMMVSMAIQSNALTITNYDALNTTPLLKATEWDVVVMDEVHKVKGGANHTPTQIFVNTKEVCKKAKFVMPLTGSPIVNHPKEMWCYLNIFDEKKFPDVRTFEREFCFGYGEVDEDGNPLVQVNWDKLIFNALKDRVIRRSKAEVLKDLPDKEREFRYLEMEGEQLVHYQNLRTNFFTWLDGEKSKALTATSILAQLTRLRQCAIFPGGIKLKDEDTGITTVLECNESAKLDEAMDIIEQLLAANEQVVVFSSQFNEPLFELARRVEQNFKAKCEVLTGANSANLDEFQTRFQQSETKVLLVNMKTGSEGLNLQKSDDWPGGASHCIFLDLWYTPAQNIQAEDRLHRMGQKDNVTIHILQCEESVDQFIAEILEKKSEMITGIMERDELRTGSDWKSLLETLL